MKKNSKILLVFLIILILAGFVVLIYQVIKNPFSQNNLDQTNNMNNTSGNQEKIYEVIYQSGEVLSAEGNVIPEDVNLEAIMPKLPPTSTLTYVYDNKRPEIRRIVLQYDVKRKADEFRNLMIQGLNDLSWDSIEERNDGSIFALREKTSVLIRTEEQGKLKLGVLFDIRIYE